MTSMYARNRTGGGETDYERCTSRAISDDCRYGAPEHALDAPLLVKVA